MEESIEVSKDDESTTVGSDDNICRPRSVSMKSDQLSTHKLITNEDLAKKRNKKIKQYIKSFIIATLIAGGLLGPILYALLKKSTFYVTHRVTQPTIPMRTRTTTIGSTTTPVYIDHCEREFVALKKQSNFIIASIVAADLDNDNNIDIISTHENNPNFFIFFNLGNDKFADAIEHKIYSTDAIVLADINNDGNIDIILGIFTYMDIGRKYGVEILLNSGKGTFNDRYILPLDEFTNVNSIIAADVNDDGKLDIIIVDASSNCIGIFFHKNNNSFSDIKFHSVGTLPMSATTTDLNGDNKTDIIVANTKSDTISILYNQGSDTFSTPINFQVDMGPIFITAAKINNDDKLDIILVHYFSSNVVILINNNNGTLTRSTTLSDLINPLSVSISDYNNDGTLDIIVPQYHSNYVSIFFNSGYGTFDKLSNYVTYPLPRVTAVADINNDNRPDIIVGAGSYIGAIFTKCNFTG